MVALTASRVFGKTGDLQFARTAIIGSKTHEALLRSILPEAALILEPFRRNSAPAVAAASLASEKNDLVLILPADHHIADVPAFHAAIGQGVGAARAGRIVTFGITPDHPATGYGYIESDPGQGVLRPVLRFVEKPDRATAQAWLATGRYLWNAGIFLFRAETMLDALARHVPDILASVHSALRKTGPLAAGEVRTLDRVAFAACPCESIDYAVMERDTRISVTPVDMGWSDLGDYAALRALSAVSGEAVASRGPVVAHKATGFARSEGPVIALHDVQDVAVVATRDAVLVTRLDAAAGIKPAVEAVARLGPAAQIPEAQRARMAHWLFAEVLPLWLETAWDVRQGGFVECLTQEGRPQPDLPRRMRIVPRQIFAFCEAVRLRTPDADAARALALAGLEYLDGPARSRRGGWVHRLNPDGSALDERRGFYDHAFVVLAGASAYSALGEAAGLSIAREALRFINDQLRAPDGRGWFDPHMDSMDRLANPHMHLLEACLALYAASGDSDALAMADEIVTLFESAMFSMRTGALVERLDENWRPRTETGAHAGMIRTEPGHCYEWAYLLAAYDGIRGRDLLSWRRRMIRFADSNGRNAEGFAVNAIAEDGRIMDGGRRLWPQLEMLRARMHHPETAASGEAARLLQALEDSYLCGACRGGWMDAYDVQGRPVAQAVPASMLYHIMTAIGPVAKP